MVVLGWDDCDKFLWAVEKKPREFFATSVTHLCLSYSVSSEKASRILEVCSGIVELALWVDFGGALVPTPQHHTRTGIKPGASLHGNRSVPSVLSSGIASKSHSPLTDSTRAANAMASLNLRRLSIEHRHLLSSLSPPANEPRIHPMWFHTLTHLEVVFWKGVAQPCLPGLEVLTSLTHLALGIGQVVLEDVWLRPIVDACPTLRALIPILHEEEVIEDPFKLGSCWVVPIHEPPNVVKNWESSYWGLEDNYARAEEEIRIYIESQGNISQR